MPLRVPAPSRGVPPGPTHVIRGCPARRSGESRGPREARSPERGAARGDPTARGGGRSRYRGGVDAKTRARIVSAALILMFAVVFIATAVGG
ncbi:hypothetical protein GCM10027160_13830 [Streptomyces calidiresistens]